MHPLKKFIVPFLLIICSATMVFADEGEMLLALNALGVDLTELYDDEDFVSIATGSKKPVYKAPAVASVITAEQIKAMGARTLDEALETVPGLHILPSNLNRLNPVHSIRGIHAGNNPQVLVLMNGVPLKFLYPGGTLNHFRLPVTSIERVEVLRGPGSAVYGADAYSGVINIITKTATDVAGTEVGARYGSFDSRNLWLLHGDSYGELDVMLSLDWQKSSGDRDRRINSDAAPAAFSNAPGPLDTRYDQIDTHLEVGWGDWTLHNWYWQLEDTGIGAGGAQALDPGGYDDAISYLAELKWQTDKLLSNWDLSASLNYLYNYNKTHFVLLPAGVTLPIGTDGNLLSYQPWTMINFPEGVIGNPLGKDHQTGLDLVGVYEGLQSHQLRIGAGAKYQRLTAEESKNFGPGISVGTLTDVSNTPYIYIPDTDRTSFYLSLQDEWQFARDWELTSGLRFDHYSDVGYTLNPRLALVWATRYNLTTKMLYGRAFRAPAFSELYAQNNPVAVGNPDLKPETIDTVELAFDYRPTFDIQTNLSIFGYRSNGLIEAVADGNGVTKTFRNSRDQLGYGFELETSWQTTDHLTLIGSYAWQHSEDANTGKRIADAPGQQVTLAADWKFMPDWLLHPQVNYVASRHRAANDSRDEIDDYLLVDLTLRRTNILKGFELTLAVRNLFDENAREPSGGQIPDDYPLEGRSLWAEVSYRF